MVEVTKEKHKNDLGDGDVRQDSGGRAGEMADNRPEVGIGRRNEAGQEKSRVMVDPAFTFSGLKAY
jgi:hypothetical protein